jgi:Tfp pilus assembly protein PilZ
LKHSARDHVNDRGRSPGGGTTRALEDDWPARVQSGMAQGRANPSADDALRSIRVSFIRKAVLEVDSRKEEALILDIGVRGVYVERSDALPIGQRVGVRFSIPENDLPIVATCRVAWCHRAGGKLVAKNLSPGCGLEFVDIDAAAAHRVREHVREHMERDPRARQFVRHWPDPDEYLADLESPDE